VGDGETVGSGEAVGVAFVVSKIGGAGEESVDGVGVGGVSIVGLETGVAVGTRLGSGELEGTMVASGVGDGASEGVMDGSTEAAGAILSMGKAEEEAS